MTPRSRKIRRVALKPKVSKQNPSFALSSKFHNQCPQLSLQMVKPLLTLVRYLELIHEFWASKIRLRYLITIWGAPKSIKMLGKRKKKDAPPRVCSSPSQWVHEPGLWKLMETTGHRNNRAGACHLFWERRFPPLADLESKRLERAVPSGYVENPSR